MSKIEGAVTLQGTNAGVSFKCPGCGRTHHLYTQHTDPSIVGPRWTFNDDVNLPVFRPSVLCRYHEEGVSAPGATDKICHSFVGHSGAQPGEIVFLSDCTHAMAGKVIPLPDIEE